MLYRPSPSVTAVRTFSMSAGLAASTVTPGRTPPEASRTTPAIPLACCALTVAGTSKLPISTRRPIPHTVCCRFDIAFSLWIQLDRYAGSDVDFVPVAPEPHSGPRRAKRAKEILLTSRGLCRDIKGRALGWFTPMVWLGRSFAGSISVTRSRKTKYSRSFSDLNATRRTAGTVSDHAWSDWAR